MQINTMMGIAMINRMKKISPTPMLPIKPKGMAQSLLNVGTIRYSLFSSLSPPVGNYKKRSARTIVYHCSEALDSPLRND